MITRWCSSYRFRSPLRISIVSSTVGGSTITVWKRRSSAPSFSMYLRYSFSVDAPTHCSSPRASAGFSMLDASTAPSAAPAPTSVCSSSMNRMMFRFCAISLMIALSRSSNWPRYFVPAITAAMSSDSTRWSFSASGHWPLAISWARPSTIAVFPTPGSPMSTGLFFLRRERISITRSISFWRPIVGSSWPSAASWVRSRQKWSSAGVFDFFSLLGLGACAPEPDGAGPDGISLPSSRSVSARACSRFTPASVSTCAAIHFSSRSSPRNLQVLTDPIREVVPVHRPPTSSSHRLGLQHATYMRRAHRRQLGIAGLASLECRQVRGLGEDQQLVQRVYTQARDQIQSDAQPHPAQKVHRLFERQLPCVLKQPVGPPSLVRHLVGRRAQQHVARLLLIFDHLPDN